MALLFFSLNDQLQNNLEARWINWTKSVLLPDALVYLVSQDTGVEVAAAMSLRLHQQCGLERADHCLLRIAHHLFSLRLLEFSETEEVKHKNAHLSYSVWMVSFTFYSI